MQLVDRIEKRRFVGREFLLWLWFETEVFDASISTKEHGSFLMWVERQFGLSEAKEVTRIRGSKPASGREAKEALRRGKLPEVAGWHLSHRDQESNFVLKAESMGVGTLQLPAVLGGEEQPAPAFDGPPSRRRKKTGPVVDGSDQRREAFEERMKLTREFESIVEALYRDFLALRLGPAWKSVVVPAMKAWAAGGREIDVATYRKARNRALSGAKK